MAEPNETDPRPIAEISHEPSAFESFLDKNQKSLLALAVVLSLGGIAWVVKKGIDEGGRIEAGAALVAAEEADELSAVVKDHAGTPAAVSASVLLSDTQWNDGQQSAALETLREQIAAHPDHPATVPARARLGARLMEQGETDAATAAFKDLLARKEASYLAPYALTSLAEIARASGDEDKARELLGEAQAGYPRNPLSSVAGEITQFVSFEMPTEIDPPAPEAVDEDPATSTLPPVPDLSNPIELDPSNPLPGAGSNPLLQNLDPGADSSSSSPGIPVIPDAPVPPMPDPVIPPGTEPAPDQGAPDISPPDAPSPEATDPEPPAPDEPTEAPAEEHTDSDAADGE